MIFYIELIIFVMKGFNAHFDFLLKLGCRWVGGMVHGEGGRGRGLGRHDWLDRGGGGTGERHGPRVGFSPRLSEIKRNRSFVFVVSISNKFYSNSNDF
jgi:hypothetical protein